ncbi:hypothetical protein L1049_014796 [Liquidambar formosana]|uniref:SKP1-like protein n=1 Tax=Liquidambar formosana TaxID=63359 RepID=A0AAP0S3T7_LIQFO
MSSSGGPSSPTAAGPSSSSASGPSSPTAAGPSSSSASGPSSPSASGPSSPTAAGPSSSSAAGPSSSSAAGPSSSSAAEPSPLFVPAPSPSFVPAWSSSYAAASSSAAGSSSSSSKKITLKCSDGQTFQVDEVVALQSETIKHIIEDDCADGVIPLPNVTSNILIKVIEYCKYHIETPFYDEITGWVNQDLLDWDNDFVKVDQDTLFDLILAANYLAVKGLLDLTCRTVADKLKGRTVEQMRETFHIQNDLTPEQEENIRKEHAWAFEN